MEITKATDSVKVNKSINKDAYGWEIKIHSDSPEEIVKKLKELDKKLREAFGNQEHGS